MHSKQETNTPTTSLQVTCDTSEHRYLVAMDSETLAYTVTDNLSKAICQTELPGETLLVSTSLEHRIGNILTIGMLLL